MPSLASADPRVLVVHRPGPVPPLSEAFHRLRAELSIQGFDVESLELDASGDLPENLDELAKSHHAVAAIALTQRANAPVAEVCIADRVTGKRLIRILELHPGPEAPNVLAVRATDLLRSSLLELEPTPSPPPDVMAVDRQPTSDVVRRFASPPRRTKRLEVGASLLGVGQGVGIGVAPTIGIGGQFVDGFGASVSFAGPALGATYQTASGTAVITQELGLARGWITLVNHASFEARALGAVGVYHLDTHGEVAPPLASRSGQVTSFAGGLGLEIAVRLASQVGWKAEILAVGLAPRPAVAVLTDTFTFPWLFASATSGLYVDF